MHSFIDLNLFPKELENCYSVLYHSTFLKSLISKNGAEMENSERHRRRNPSLELNEIKYIQRSFLEK